MSNNGVNKIVEKENVNINEVRTTPYSWFIAFLLFCTFATSVSTRFLWSTAVPVAAEPLGLTMAAAGGLMTAYYIGYVISNAISGRFIEKFGPRNVLTVSTLLTGLFTLAIPFSKGYMLIFILRVLAGIASGPIIGGVGMYQLSYFSPARRATAMGAVMAGISFGTFMANGLFAPIIQNQGWKASFIYAGIICVIFSVIFFIFAKEKGISSVRGSKLKVKTAEEKQAEKVSVRKVIMQKSYILGVAANIFFLFGAMGFSMYGILFLTQTRGYSLTVAGAIMGFSVLIGVIANPTGGAVADFLRSKKIVIIIGAIIIATCTLLLLANPSLPLLWVIMLTRMFFNSITGSQITALQASTGAGPYVSRALGINSAFGQSASMIAPTVFGFLLDWSGMNFTMMIVIISISFTLCAISIAFADEKKAPKSA